MSGVFIHALLSRVTLASAGHGMYFGRMLSPIGRNVCYVVLSLSMR